jgi:hypothetical protein
MNLNFRGEKQELDGVLVVIAFDLRGILMKESLSPSWLHCLAPAYPAGV